MFQIIQKNFWAIALGVTVINAVIFRVKAARQYAKHPERAKGYGALVRGYLLWGSLPWLVMGIGSTLGGVPTPWHYLRPQDGDPFVIAWFGSLGLLGVLGTYWIFYKGGAEMLVSHPGVLSMDFSSPALVRFFWLAALLGGAMGLVFLSTIDFPLPPAQ